MDSLTHSLLLEIIRQEGRSLLQYVKDGAFPWTTPVERAALTELYRMIEEEQQAVASLSRFLQRRHLPAPHLGPYPMSFTNINYVSLEHLLPVLIERQKRAIADLERDLTCLIDGEAKEQVQKVLEMKRRHLAKLEKLAQQPAAA